ncbi:hypothetical protein [Paraburkholderia sp. BL10I2N1]|uniref:hypothetical protein n=1 Tax=Paraburkholderia sp. BL10I2N1 TaxID=1938796 RepID=UPI00105B6845|nr:hypothetical protein [Paraburkholderia sp. BL10I2N1]TDN70453.1 hypothetical protein B0G77_3927 [Paraburkholderia sp. BL10I2N1]
MKITFKHRNGRHDDVPGCIPSNLTTIFYDEQGQGGRMMWLSVLHDAPTWLYCGGDSPDLWERTVVRHPGGGWYIHAWDTRFPGEPSQRFPCRKAAFTAARVLGF